MSSTVSQGKFPFASFKISSGLSKWLRGVLRCFILCLFKRKAQNYHVYA